jgi:hypothetical protein
MCVTTRVLPQATGSGHPLPRATATDGSRDAGPVGATNTERPFTRMRWAARSPERGLLLKPTDHLTIVDDQSVGVQATSAWGAPADVGEGRGAFLRWMSGERRRTLSKPPPRRPLGPTRPRPRPRGGARPKSQQYHEIGQMHRKEAPTGAQRGPLGAHWGPCWGPLGVGRIIPLGFQEIGSKSASGAQWAH